MSKGFCGKGQAVARILVAASGNWADDRVGSVAGVGDKARQSHRPDGRRAHMCVPKPPYQLPVRSEGSVGGSFPLCHNCVFSIIDSTGLRGKALLCSQSTGAKPLLCHLRAVKLPSRIAQGGVQRHRPSEPVFYRRGVIKAKTPLEVGPVLASAADLVHLAGKAE